MNDLARRRRTLAASGLVLAALLSVMWTLLEPPFPSGYAARLAAVQEAGTTALVSAAVFALSQLPMLVAVVAMGRLARDASPRLAGTGTALAVVGAFGHSVFAGVSLVSVLMARDVENRDVHAALLEELEGEPAVMLFAAAGLLGTVLGLLLLSVALWRSGAVARWIPPVIWAFLVVEFVGANLSDYATYVAGTCLVIAFGALAHAVMSSPPQIWVTLQQPDERAAESVPAGSPRRSAAWRGVPR